MKRSGLIICAVLLVPICLLSQGTSCTTPIAIPLDGVCRNYTISSATGDNLVCTNSGTSPTTYFSIVANSSAQNMLLKITGPNTQAVEVAFYDGTSCTNGNLRSQSSICFYDGNGVWAPSPNFTITANKTYILRIKTAITGTIQICGQYYTPPNNSCLSATTIGTTLTFDNNATHKSTTDITTTGLCAPDIDNTAFYVYTVDVTGTSGISIENMNFDNNYQSNLLNLGYQVGLFTGSCGSLTNLNCYVGVYNAQISAGILPAGTKVYVAIDGILESNCDYAIRAINAVILSASLKYFTAFKTADENILKWVSMNEDDNAFFEVQRSTDAINYTTIDRIAGQVNSTVEKNYQYIDASPPSKSYYRLKMITTDGKNSYSNILRVERGSKGNLKITFNNLVTDQLSLQINDLKQEKVLIKIIDQSGREVYRQNTQIRSGYNLINLNTEKISSGVYYLILSGVDYREAFPFVKS